MPQPSSIFQLSQYHTSPGPLHQGSKSAFRSLFLLIITVLLFSSLTPSAQENPAGTGNLSRNRDTYYEATKQKMLGNQEKATELFKKALEQDPSDAAAMYELAGIYIEKGKLSDALPLAESASETDKQNKWYKLQLVQVYQGLGKYEDAGRIIGQLVALDPENISYYEEQALNYIYSGDYKNAIRTYDLLESKLGMMEEISIQKEKIYIMTGKPDKAIEEIQKLSNAYPDEPRYLEMLAELYMNSGIYDQALITYNKILQLDPENPYINISLSDYYRKQGDLEKSNRYLQAGFANPNLDIDTKVNILLAYYSVNEIYGTYKEEAFDLATILVTTHPNDPKAHSIYADLLVQDKRYEEARQAFNKVLSLDSSRYLVWEQLMFVESELEDYKAMSDIGKRASNLFPEQPLPYLFAGAADFQLKDFESAARSFRTGVNFVVSNDKLLAQFYSYLGDTYFQLKDHQKSDEAYEKVLTIDPANSLVLNNYAYYLSLRGENLEKAEQMAKKATELDPDNPSNQDTYGWVLYRLGRYEEARTWIGKAIENGEGSSAVVLEHCGDVLWKLGDKKEAMKYWERAKEAGEGSEFLNRKIQDKTLYE
jgi:tetratricopeptide (TPR) repeat protein